MKYHNRCLLFISGFWLTLIFSGCAAVKETGKGFLGVSTQILEEKRPQAMKKSFILDFDYVYSKVKEILTQTNNPVYIYAQDPQAKMLAVYLSANDTTPVGIFFTVQPQNETLVEVSSPSVYAQEELAARIFTALEALVSANTQGEKIDAQEETDTKAEFGDQ